VGIDLGTSRSAVSAANGNRELVESYVGWPKDFVAQKMLGRPVLFGADALEHRLSLDLVRPLAAGVIKDTTEREEDAVRELTGHLVELAGAAPGQKIHVAVGIPAEALKVNRDAIRDAISQFTDKLILVSEPFSVAFGLGMLDNAMVVDIGAGTVDFCIMHGTEPAHDDQRSLLTAGDSVDDALLSALKENYPDSDFTLNLVRRFKEQHGLVGAARRKVVVEVPVKGRMMSHDITEEMRRACESIMAPIAETLLDATIPNSRSGCAATLSWPAAAVKSPVSRITCRRRCVSTRSVAYRRSTIPCSPAPTVRWNWRLTPPRSVGTRSEPRTPIPTEPRHGSREFPASPPLAMNADKLTELAIMSWTGH
jgi:rod shape-determining protein MreB